MHAERGSRQCAASPPAPCQRCQQQQALQPIDPRPFPSMRCIPYKPSPAMSMRCRVIGVCYFGVTIGKPAGRAHVQCRAGWGRQC